jgi:hypothetical protein
VLGSAAAANKLGSKPPYFWGIVEDFWIHPFIWQHRKKFTRKARDEIDPVSICPGTSKLSNVAYVETKLATNL